MFHKREKKTFAPGTFIATPARVLAIIHLCLAFTLLLWIASKPFMADLFAVKSEMLLYESILDQPQWIATLPTDQQQAIMAGYEKLKEKLQMPFFEKLKNMLLLLFIYTPPLELAWLFFSLIIPILLLMRIEGAAHACWLLPLITFAYSVDNFFYAESKPHRFDRELFPSEKWIVKNHLSTPLSSNIFEQQKQLTSGWQRFLVESWAGEIPAHEEEQFRQQVRKGEFAFTVARLHLRANVPILSIDIKPKRLPLVLLGLYLFWNGLFAFVAHAWCLEQNFRYTHSF